MTEKELRRLSRKELLEILIDQTKEISSLRETVQNLESQLNERKIAIAESGSLAEASLKLNGIFADADRAAKQYLENVRMIEEERKRLLEDTRRKAAEIVAEAEKIRSAKIHEANLYVNRVKAAIRDYWLRHPELRRSADEKKQ